LMTTDLVILYWPDMYYKLPNAYQPIKHKIYLPAGGGASHTGKPDGNPGGIGSWIRHCSLNTRKVTRVHQVQH